MRKWILAAALAAAVVPGTARAQYFGQNKVQYRNFRFEIIRTEHFDVYYYPGERAAALDAARMAERGYARLSRMLSHEWRERKPLILYASQSDFQQTNVIQGEIGEGTGGVTEFFKHRMVLPFTGAYADFEQVLQHEMVHAFQYDVFSSGRAGAGLQALMAINPPDWFMEGMAMYLSIGPFDPHTTMWLRDAAVEGNLPTIEQLTYDARIFPYRYGHAIWSYIGQKWGDEVVGALLQATMTGGVEQAFRRVLGISLEQLSDEWRDAVQTWYLPQIGENQRARRFARAVLNERNSGGTYHVAPQISPDGRRIAYLSERNFFFIDLYLADAETGRVQRRLVRSSLDPDFETLRFVNSTGSWSPDGERFAIAVKRGDQDNLVIIDVARRREVARHRLGVNAILNPTWSPDGTRIAFTGMEGGISDLYVVDADGANLRRLTNDQYAELLPNWSPDGNAIAFTTDRGEATDFSGLRFGNLRIALYNLATGAVEVLPGMDVGMNTNAVWAPDGNSLAFLSDRSGIRNVFLYDLPTREVYQLTRAYTGVTGITELSPAISWARQADRLVFTYYEGGEYNVYSIDNPRSLRREPWRPEAGGFPVLANAAAQPVRTELASQGRVVRADTTARIVVAAAANAPAAAAPAPGLPPSASIYRTGPGQMRASDDRPPAPDSGVAGPLSVQALLDSTTLALPDTTEFTFRRYGTRFTPDYVSRPTIGYARDSFGRGIFGGTSIQLSDILGNHTLIFSGMVNGRLSEAQAGAVYVNSQQRLNWAVGLMQEPYFYWGGQTLSGGTGPYGGDMLTEQIFRYVFRQGFAQAVYPFSRFRRVEIGARVTNVSLAALNLETEYLGGFPTGYYNESYQDLGSVTYIQPTLALTHDNSLFGWTSPFYGTRWRLELAPSFGDWQFTQLLADYRRYVMIAFPFSFAFRGFALGRVGRDGDMFPLYMGWPDYVRGYTYASYDGGECSQATAGSSTGCAELDQLIGSRIAVFNAEFRFPLVRSLTLGFLPIGFPPIEAAAFFDAGIAWHSGSSVHLSKPADADLLIDRWPMTSYGVGIRVNMFGFTVLRVDYAVPLQRRYTDSERNKSGYWIVSLGPPF